MTGKSNVLKETYTILVDKDNCQECARARIETSSKWLLSLLLATVTVIILVLISVIFNFTKVRFLEDRLNDLEQEIKQLRSGSNYDLLGKIHEDSPSPVGYLAKHGNHLSDIFSNEDFVSGEDLSFTHGDIAAGVVHDDHDEAESIDYPSRRRRKREVDVTTRTQDGIEIHERGYGITFNRTEGLRIYQSLLFGGKSEPKDPSLAWDVTEMPVLPHHRQNSIWSERAVRQMTGPSFDTSDLYTRGSTTHRPTSHPTVVLRQNRVKHTSGAALTPQPVQRDQRHLFTDMPVRHQHTHKKKRNPSNPSKKEISKAELVAPSPTDIENQLEDESFAVDLTPQEIQATIDKQDRPLVPIARKGKPRKNGRLIKKPLKQVDLGATHFVSFAVNSSNLILENEGDIPVENDFGLYKNWVLLQDKDRKTSARQFSTAKQHILRHEDGTFHVRDSGLYLIYSQVYYMDSHRSNAYEVVLNEEPFLHCAVTKEATTTGQTCYTSGVTFLQEGDRIYLRDLEPQRTYIINPSKTFFGCVKLKGVKAV